MKLLIYSYVTIGILYSLITILIIFKSDKSATHIKTLKEKFNNILSFGTIGKIMAVVALILSLAWLILGWPISLINGLKNKQK